jgi:hypothetical protein
MRTIGYVSAILCFSFSAWAANKASATVSTTYMGMVTITDYSNGSPVVTSLPDQLTITYTTDGNGNFLPEFSATEVLNSNTVVTTFSNPVALTGPVAGYTFDMSGSVNGSPAQKVGQFEAYGAPGSYTSNSFLKSQVIGAPYFQTGINFVTTNSDGTTTRHRRLTIVDGNGQVVETIESDLTSASSAHR